MPNKSDTADAAIAHNAAKQPCIASTAVSTPSTGRISRRGIHLHRCPSILTRRHRIPVTTIQRTVDDLDGCVPPYLVRRAKRQAELKGIHLQGTERKRQRSDLEEDFLALFALASNNRVY